MNNVLEILRHIANKGGIWTYKKLDDVWFIDPRYVQTDSGVAIGVTKDELREFLKHYEELSKPSYNIFGVCSEGDETDEEILANLNRLDGK
jgi:hypothetical protein